jgi:hypothetical protein
VLRESTYQATTAPREREPSEHEHDRGLHSDRVDAVVPKSESDRFSASVSREREKQMLTPDVSVTESHCACDRAIKHLVERVEVVRWPSQTVCHFARQFVYIEANHSENLASEVTFGSQPSQEIN